MAARSLLVVGLVLVIQPAGRWARAIEPPTKVAAPTHVIVSESPYYTTSPAQARPPDGQFKPGTRVKLLRKAGGVFFQTHTASSPRHRLAIRIDHALNKTHLTVVVI